MVIKQTQLWLWTWGGKCFGYKDQNNLWTYSGKHVGVFNGNEVYDPMGKYLGEIMNGDRLITNINKKHVRCGSFSPYAQRASYVKYADYVGYVMYAGYEDFPIADLV